MNKKNTIIITLLIIVLALAGYIFIQQKQGSALVVKNNPGTNIIQAKLIAATNPTYASLSQLYEGELTFQDLNDNKQHIYNVCLEDWSTVKLNAIYDLPANYYIQQDPSTQSIETAGCNGPLHLSPNQ